MPWPEEAGTNAMPTEQDQMMRKSVDLKMSQQVRRDSHPPDDSAISESMSHLHPKDMQNPQGESQGYGTQGEDDDMRQELA